MPRTLWCSGLSSSTENVPDPAVEAVLAWLRADYEDWGWADPMLGLFWYERPSAPLPPFPGLSSDQLVAQLLAIRHQERGYYFEFSEHGGQTARRWLVSRDSTDDPSEWVPNMSYGEEAFFLASCFVPLAKSERVVADFMTAPEPSPMIEWVSFEQLSPRRSERPRAK